MNLRKDHYCVYVDYEHQSSLLSLISVIDDDDDFFKNSSGSLPDLSVKMMIMILSV